MSMSYGLYRTTAFNTAFLKYHNRTVPPLPAGCTPRLWGTASRFIGVEELHLKLLPCYVCFCKNGGGIGDDGERDF